MKFDALLLEVNLYILLTFSLTFRCSLDREKYIDNHFIAQTQEQKRYINNLALILAKVALSLRAISSRQL